MAEVQGGMMSWAEAITRVGGLGEAGDESARGLCGGGKQKRENLA